MAQGFDDGRVVVKINLRQQRRQTFTERGPIFFEIGSEQIFFTVG
jgi:hypothetical protein